MADKRALDDAVNGHGKHADHAGEGDDEKELPGGGRCIHGLGVLFHNAESFFAIEESRVGGDASEGIEDHSKSRRDQDHQDR